MSPALSKTYSTLAATTFFAKSHPGDVCGSNGLPLTPNSIAILGRAQILKTISHPNLCEYLDIIRGKHERTIIVSEYFGTALSEFKNIFYNHENILRIFYQLADGLSYLNQNGFICHNLEPSNVLIDSLNNVKIFNYGLFHMTNDGEYVSFPIGNIHYMPPERLHGAKNNPKSDVWSLGIIITELIFHRTLWSSLKLSQNMRKILSLCNATNVLEKIARENNAMDIYEAMNPLFKELLSACLSIATEDRPTTMQILQHEIFKSDPDLYLYKAAPIPSMLLLRSPLKQIYYWWQLAGGDVQTELRKEGLIRSEAPILYLPKFVTLNGEAIGSPPSQNCMLDKQVVILSLANLTQRLAKIKQQAYFPLIHSPKFHENYGEEMEKLPLIIRERDTEYQFYRVVLFNRLLKGYPFTRDLICNEAAKDIPPYFRGRIWACLLNVLENNSYDGIDKITPTITDRQIDVDIPRCHQYDELLSSPEGHRKLKRLLKAWVTMHPQYVYWQGLDSLTAPFLYLNFSYEERAFLSLYKFIPKYLHWFFLQDNSVIIREYLSKFSQLTTYHEPVLAKHLHEINFIPELFAIPWFLTMFSHVFPLHKILHLWDKLLLGDNRYPLFIGISVLKQLKTTLLSSGFNECILLFSDLPDIEIEKCVIETQKMYLSTPKSISYRKNVVHDKKPTEFDINNVELTDLQNEICPRISASDVGELLDKQPERIAIIDLRNNLEFKRAHIHDSINIPFTSVLLGDPRLDTLGVSDLEHLLSNKIVALVSCLHDNSILFARFLVDCKVERVCIVHNGFNIFYAMVPNLIQSS